jgi:Tfp pilus assembly protein PilX
MMRRDPRRPGANARGAATLTVVMILFFILAMVAAYTNRTLIVDQRASANNMRGAMAMEAAEAGIEWALMHLNGPRATQTCDSSDQQADLEFRTRYLTLNADST